MGCRRYGGIMIELVRRRMMMGGSAKPYDAEVEYLESTGTQYIDTGIIVNNQISMECVMAMTSATPIYSSQGMTLSYNCGWFNVGCYGEATLVAFFSANSRGGVQISYDRDFHTYFISASLQRIDNTIAHDNSGQHIGYNTDREIYQEPLSIYMFARHIAWTATDDLIYSHLKIKNCRIRFNNILIADYITVRVGNVGYMYDKVSRQLFGNQGTGQFIIGPDKTV